jgi:hypothetical protein
MNKIAHLWSVAAGGARFEVLPGEWLLAIEHERSTSWEVTFGEAKASQKDGADILEHVVYPPCWAYARETKVSYAACPVPPQDSMRKLHLQALYRRFKKDVAAGRAVPMSTATRRLLNKARAPQTKVICRWPLFWHGRGCDAITLRPQSTMICTPSQPYRPR